MRTILQGTEVASAGITVGVEPEHAYRVGRYPGAILETRERRW